MLEGSDAEPARRSMRAGRACIAAAWIVVLSSAPFVQLSIRVQHLPLDPNTASYLYPYWIAAIAGVWLFASDVWAQAPRRSMLLCCAPAAAFASWLLASTTWGNSPYTAPRELLLIAALIPGAWWFGGGLRPIEQLVAMLLALHALVGASLLAVWLAPGTSISLGNWNGVFANRNSLAPVAALGALFAVVAAVASRDRRVWVVAGVVALVDLVVLLQTGGDTSVLALVGAVGLIAVALVVRRLRGHTIAGRRVTGAGVATAVAALAAVAWFVFFAFIGSITSAVGKDSTLSNRRVVWQYLREVTAERRWTGFGYASFWDDANLVYPLYLRTQTIFDSAHSSIMETYVAAGLVGVAALIAVIGLGIARVARGVWQRPGVEPIAWVGVFGFCALQNLTESLFAYHSFMWLLVVAAGALGVLRPAEPAS